MRRYRVQHWVDPDDEDNHEIYVSYDGGVHWHRVYTAADVSTRRAPGLAGKQVSRDERIPIPDELPG